ncbi:E3 ubiquitin-protein ligase KCMF1 [Operophtera brumata]|uniref:RING-type E3 ubiquitin transferase n=1 Tax=Operophtera brumata TaxID=104452 RepID=A0A0L7L859_OPEBR|nr:E3 ubiquitin-protein ligase KCMF1 [Operophtera brumata]
MNRHEGVSCDSCLKNNFRGRRYKCLICIDYDLCAACYESGATTNQHTTEHPMQCILSRSDFGVHLPVLQQDGLHGHGARGARHCGTRGHHTSCELRSAANAECLYYGGEALTLEQPQAYTCPHGGVRRMPHSGRGVSRARRTNMQFSTAGGISSLSPSSRDAVVDPIAELLSQLSGVRRAGQPGTPSQLQQLQMQLQLERQQATVSTYLHSVPALYYDTHANCAARRPARHAQPAAAVTDAAAAGAFHLLNSSTAGGISSLSPSSRDAVVDPIAELLSQLSGVRRAGQPGTPSQLQQLQMQLQLERQQATVSTYLHSVPALYYDTHANCAARRPARHAQPAAAVTDAAAA